MSIDYQHHLSAVQQAFRDTRELILAGHSPDATIYKSDGSPVTDIDTAAETQITRFLQAQLPDASILGEESGYDDQNLPDTCWLIDPIDGTESYLNDIPTFTSMGVLIQNNEAVASVIYDPTTDDMYHAITGQGAYKNNDRLDLTKLPLPKQVFAKRKVIPTLHDILKEKQLNIGVGTSGAGYGFSTVASGKTAARFHMHSGPHIHDHAPGALLVREAGGALIPILEDNYTFRTRSFVACHPDLTELVHLHLDTLRKLEDPRQALA